MLLDSYLAYLATNYALCLCFSFVATISYLCPKSSNLSYWQTMNSKPVKRQSSSSETPEVGIYECEVHMKFRLIEEKQVVGDRDHLLETLLDAVACGTDEYLNDLQVQVTAEELSEIEASPRMRRQIIRLRNSRDFV